eukprot:s1551_g1.t2
MYREGLVGNIGAQLGQKNAWRHFARAARRQSAQSGLSRDLAERFLEAVRLFLGLEHQPEESPEKFWDLQPERPLHPIDDLAPLLCSRSTWQQEELPPRRGLIQEPITMSEALRNGYPGTSPSSTLDFAWSGQPKRRFVEQIRTLRTRFENREEQLRDLGERVERSDWDVKLSQIRQAIQEHNQQRTLQSEKLELLTKRVEYQEQVVEDVRFASRPALEPPLGIMEPVAVEDFAAPSALAVLEDQMKVMTAAIQRLQEGLPHGAEPQEDKLGLGSLILQLKEISPKVIAHEKSIRRLEDGATSQAESKLANEVSETSAGLVSLKERLERLDVQHAQTDSDSEQKLQKLRQDLADELRDLRHRTEENLKELSSELTPRLAKLETQASSESPKVELEKLESRWEKRFQQLQERDDGVKGLDIEYRLDRIEAQGKAEEEKWLKFQQELQDQKQQMESRLELLQVPSLEDQDFGKDLILKREGTWSLNGSHGPYTFDPRNGWLSVKDQRIGRF